MLDEPNSNLDPEGEAALARAITGVKARGGVVLLVAHRPAVLSTVALVLLMRATAQAFDRATRSWHNSTAPASPAARPVLAA